MLADTHRNKHSGLVVEFHYQNIYLILFPIKTLAAIFNKTANGQVPQSSSSSSSSNQVFSDGSHGSVGVSLACCCSVIELGPVVTVIDDAAAAAAAGIVGRGPM